MSDYKDTNQSRTSTIYTWRQGNTGETSLGRGGADNETQVKIKGREVRDLKEEGTT